MKYEAVVTNGAADMQCTADGVVRKIINIYHDYVSTHFLGWYFGHRPKLFWNGWENLSQFGHIAIFSHTKVSQNEKKQQNF